MPTVILLDVSLSMTRPVQLSDGTETTRKLLAINGINAFLDHLSIHSKLEFIALMAFSSLYEERCPFTRDYSVIKSELKNIDDYDKTCLETALHGVSQIVLGEWGNNTACQVVLITDGSTGIGAMSLKESLATINQRAPTQPAFPLPFPFPVKLHIVCIAGAKEPSFLKSKSLYQKLIDLSGYDGSIQVPENLLSESNITTMFQKLAEDMYISFKGVLKCGHLESKIVLSPAPLVAYACSTTVGGQEFLKSSSSSSSDHHGVPETTVDSSNKPRALVEQTLLYAGSVRLIKVLVVLQPYTKLTDFSTQTYTVSNIIEVCGFISVADVGSPMQVTRHLILPANYSQKTESNPNEMDLADDSGTDDGNVPSFCVLLHGALKVENSAALVTVGDDWFGFVYSWADSKKKSNLMLTILSPGSDIIPWLGDLNNLGTCDLFPPDQLGNFPLRPSEKRSYSQNGVVWIKQAGLQSDIQKILRHARKLPEKTQQFYKELNRLRKAAISLGFQELLTGLANIFEQECMQLPGGVHPDCALQLHHAADKLRTSQNRDIKYVLMPMQTNYSSS